MRYFRDLGTDAHLLLYLNDGIGALSHFKPESDSWEIAKWQPYIHRTEIPNAPVAALGFTYSWFLWSWSVIRHKLGKIDWPTKAVSKKQIREAYGEYDLLIASGISPATLRRVGVSLDIFYPYSTGIEFFRTSEFTVRFGGKLSINRFIFNKVAQSQMEGIRAAKKVFNAEMGITQEILRDIGIEPINLTIPIVYNNDDMPENPPTKACQSAWNSISNSEFTLLHHARLVWNNSGHYSKDSWVKENKNNDWLLREFSELIKNRPTLKACLLIVEYGPDVDATKRLAAELEIENYIHWLPQMGRRELMWILSRVSVGVGEFYDLPRMIWGGTGWEVLASGKPLLQSFNFVDGEFEQIFNYPPPPMLRVNKQGDILDHLLDITDNSLKCKAIGKDAREWFNKYNGASLARQWLDILLALPDNNSDERCLRENQGSHV